LRLGGEFFLIKCKKIRIKTLINEYEKGSVI
jgi:hypothetical protein